MGTYYTVSVEAVEGYLPCSNKSYMASYQSERNISFQYKALGVFVEATDGTLYKSTAWASAGKTANSVVFISLAHSFRISLIAGVAKKIHSNGSDSPDSYLAPIAISNHAAARADLNGNQNTQAIYSFNVAKSTATSDYAAPYARSYAFPDGVTIGYLPSYGELYLLYQNINSVSDCLTACSGSTITNGFHWVSTNQGKDNNGNYCFWELNPITGNDYTVNENYRSYYVRPFGVYE